VPRASCRCASAGGETSNFSLVSLRPQHPGLHEKIDQLSDGQASVVSDFVEAVLAPVYSEALAVTWLTTNSDWAEAFLARLRGHHGLSIEPLSTTQFEAAFNEACISAGWRVQAARSATQRFYDTTVSTGDSESRRLSLKASSAKDMRAATVHISKLTEAAWIQDARRLTDRRDRIVELFTEYRKTTSAIVMLRGFRARQGFEVLYELLEIPTTIFAPVATLTVQQAQPGTIKIPGNAGAPDFSIRIDRSDSKVTLTGIRLGLCVIHGRWGVNHASGTPAVSPSGES
jgi:Type II site-specific deoxyribonuclease